MITVVVGKEIEKIKGDFESYLNGLNMVGEISYSQYSKLYDEGVKQIQRAYELGKSELEKELEEENKELKKKIENLQKYLDTQNSYRECAETWVKLTKAKDFIRQLCSMVRELNKPNVQLTNVDYSLSEAEQFLKEIKENE